MFKLISASAVAVVAILAPIPAAASSPVTIPSGVVIASIPPLTSPDKEAWLSTQVSPFVLPTSKVITITTQVQQQAEWCVPASSRATISAFRSSLPTQTTLASQLGTSLTNGTDPANAPGVLNSYETRNLYFYNASDSLATYESRTTGDIANFTAPVQDIVDPYYLPWDAGKVYHSSHDVTSYGYYNATKNATVDVWDPETSSLGGGAHVAYWIDMYDAGAPSNYSIVW